jgi:hypothetical protein
MAFSVNAYTAARAARCSISTHRAPRHSHQPPRQWRNVGAPDSWVWFAAANALATSSGAVGGGSTTTSGPAPLTFVDAFGSGSGPYSTPAPRHPSHS